jgi:hypothetical protein
MGCVRGYFSIENPVLRARSGAIDYAAKRAVKNPEFRSQNSE